MIDGEFMSVTSTELRENHLNACPDLTENVLLNFPYKT